MTQNNPFLLQEFWPYLLNQAAEATSLRFQQYYKQKYGMLRTEWRVLFHLGRYGPLTAKEIGARATIHKTKISRAVAALTARRFIARERVDADRRHELLSLTRTGQTVFGELVSEAERYNASLIARFTVEEARTFERMLIALTEEKSGDASDGPADHRGQSEYGCPPAFPKNLVRNRSR